MTIDHTNSYNSWRQTHIENLIKENAIYLYDDHDEMNFHFKYKDIEIKSIMSDSYPPIQIKIINTEPNDYTKAKVDNYRKVYIYMNIKRMLNDSDDEDVLDDEDIDDEFFEDDDDDYESYDDKIRRHFPGLFLTNKQIAAYDSANNKKELLHDIMMQEIFSIFSFSSIRGLKIFDDVITFDIPYLSKPTLEWMFYCCTIIDKVFKYFAENDDTFDNEDLLDEEWTN